MVGSAGAGARAIGLVMKTVLLVTLQVHGEERVRRGVLRKAILHSWGEAAAAAMNGVVILNLFGGGGGLYFRDLAP